MEDVKVRVYTPKNSINNQKAIMIYYHGGGFFMGVMIKL